MLITVFSDSSTEFHIEPLPKCHPDVTTPPTLAANGFWFENVWNPLDCRKLDCWGKVSFVGKCLQNKEVYILGDSNGRQYYSVLSTLLGTASKAPLLKGHEYIKSFNVTTYFQFHPEVISGAWINHSDTMYEVNIFDNLTNEECNYVLIVSTWSHFLQWPKHALLERLLLLKKAVQRFRSRCPGVPIIFKSPHPREHRGGFGSVIYSNFLLNGVRNLLRKLLNNTGVLFLDIWDMNVAYPSANNVHMPDKVIEQEMFMVLSYVCDYQCY